MWPSLSGTIWSLAVAAAAPDHLLRGHRLPPHPTLVAAADRPGPATNAATGVRGRPNGGGRWRERDRGGGRRAAPSCWHRASQLSHARRRLASAPGAPRLPALAQPRRLRGHHRSKGRCRSGAAAPPAARAAAPRRRRPCCSRRQHRAVRRHPNAPIAAHPNGARR